MLKDANTLPAFALAHVLDYLTFPETSVLFALSKAWRLRLSTDGEPIWKQQIQQKLGSGCSQVPPPDTFFVRRGGNVRMSCIARAFDVDPTQLTIVEGVWKPQDGYLDAGTLVKVEFAQARPAKVRTGRRRKTKSKPTRKLSTFSWWQQRKNFHLSQVLTAYLQDSKVAMVRTPNKFDCKFIADLKPLTARIENGVYMYSDDHGREYSSKNKFGYLADRYLLGYSVQGTEASARHFDSQGLAFGRCLGSTRSRGWCVLGQDESRVHHFLTMITQDERMELYGLHCINNLCYGTARKAVYLSSIRILLNAFMGAAEPGATFLYGTHVLRLPGTTENDDDPAGREDVSDDSDDDDDDESDPFEYLDTHRNYHNSYGLMADVMTVAIGTSRVVSFYYYLNRYYG
ncbi:expressed unknown protein [Seminavis robusta]|uniref:F-box domain-containing protein n=1 Tax=Seminavis robusta TaxID=568900 RepID=A0A9N8HRI7_9STRA|nr:expressed unknown protein [Seminavis robusta]|eukprot:Sro1078_g238740.1 n/a (401) ;mRNA; f:14264-15466